MKFFVISDLHLKSWILDCADKAIAEFKPDRIVLLGDYVDDWNANLEQYEKMMARCMQFAKDHPDAIWLWGNHDAAYVSPACTGCQGHSAIAHCVLTPLFNKLERLTTGFKFVHYEDSVFFSHGGITSAWIRPYPGKLNDFKAIEEWINSMSFAEMWDDLGPLWYRPHTHFPLFSYNGIIQIVGHTPAKRIAQWQNATFTDVFSTYGDDKKPIGTEEFYMYDSDTNSGLCIHSKTLKTKQFGG